MEDKDINKPALNLGFNFGRVWEIIMDPATGFRFWDVILFMDTLDAQSSDVLQDGRWRIRRLIGI